MLVLSRRERERIRLGDSIVVTVVRIGPDKVRLGIEAPADMLVLREELEPLATGPLPSRALLTGPLTETLPPADAAPAAA